MCNQTTATMNNLIIVILRFSGLLIMNKAFTARLILVLFVIVPSCIDIDIPPARIKCNGSVPTAIVGVHCNDGTNVMGTSSTSACNAHGGFVHYWCN